MISNTKFTQELEFYSEMIGCFISEIRAWYNLFFFFSLKWQATRKRKRLLW